jgi:RNA polymerase sigma factor (TIGR02999 family)
MSEATELLAAIGSGDQNAAARLWPLVYHELRQTARAQMARERAGHTLQATALVHEAYVRLLKGQPDTWQGRRHFFGAAAEAMRRILVEHARNHNAAKRGAGQSPLPLEQDQIPAISSPCDQIEDILSLNDALDRFAQEDPPKAELVKLLYFAGLSLEEAAAALGLSKTTAHRQWVFARTWLYEAMKPT